MAKGDTHFGGLVYSMGVPTVGGGGIPLTFGTYYFVDADIGSDGNPGTSMDRALKTVLAAYNKTTTNKHDVIVLSGVGPHVIADEIIVSKNRVHFVGLGLGSRHEGQRTRFEMGVTAGAAIAIIQVTGVGCTFTNIKFRSTDTLATSLYTVADGGEFTQFSYCSFEKDALLTTATVAELLCNGDTSKYDHCSFGNGIYTVAAARQNVLFTRETITGKVARSVRFEDCHFQSRCNDTAFVNCTATTNDIERYCVMKDCMFQAVKTSPAAQADVFGIASALTDARITLQGDCFVDNIAEIASVAGVFVNGSIGTAKDDGLLGIAVT